MAYFQVNSEFNDYESVLATKKLYEESTNTLLVKGDCLKLKDKDGELAKQFVYQRIEFNCKAGLERKTRIKGIRNSSTIKKNCTVRVSI